MAKVEVRMPKMGESITEGTVLEWLKKPGDVVELDESLLEIGTDKVDTEVPSPSAGTLESILVPEGETVDVGTPIAVIATEGASVSAGDGSVDATEPAAAAPTVDVSAAAAATAPFPAPPPVVTPPPVPTPPAHAAAPAPQAPADAGQPIPRHTDDGRFCSPLVRSIADRENISPSELASIVGSGHGGRVTKKDVLAFLDSRKSSRVVTDDASAPARQVLSRSAPIPSKAPGGRVEIIQMDRMRQIISEHMTRSKATSAHVTSFGEADVTNLVRLRERNKDAFLAREGVKLTYTPFFVYAAVEALRDHPILNASVVDKEIHLKKDYHIGIAVAIGKTGLVVPVIHDAGQKNIVGLAHSAADLASRTRNKQLLPDQLQGGTFTVTNVGSLGSIMGTPIINQPQVGILATGAIKKRPVVIEDPVLGDTIGIRSMMYISLSYDHRVVDGAMGSSFLARFVEVLSTFDPNEEISGSHTR